MNGQPGALFVDREGRLIGVMALGVAEGQIQSVSSIITPDELRHLGPLADLGAPAARAEGWGIAPAPYPPDVRSQLPAAPRGQI